VRDPVYRLVIAFARALIAVMRWRPTVKGAEHIPADGGAVIALNHIGYLDFVFAGYTALPRKRLVRFMAKAEVFRKPGVGWLMRAMKHIPVDRFGDPAESLREATARLQAGQLVGMFPEGTISPSFVTRPGKSGAVRMAQQAGVPVIPMAVWGTHRIITKWRPKNFKRNIAIVVSIGAPISIGPEEDPNEVTARLMDQIATLLAEAQATYPQQPAGEADRWWVPAHLGGTAPTVDEAEIRLKEEREAREARRSVGEEERP
jgi:1-acyl-sn-glycerol-3-phosphate acyltransferase